jgi:hypothetical protein
MTAVEQFKTTHSAWRRTIDCKVIRPIENRASRSILDFFRLKLLKVLFLVEVSKVIPTTMCLQEKYGIFDKLSIKVMELL